MKISQKWIFPMAGCLLLIVQTVGLLFAGAPWFLVIAAVCIELFILLIAVWNESRVNTRHDQLVKRIARASTRPEVNQLKWQLAERDDRHHGIVANQLRRIDNHLAERSVDVDQLLSDLHASASQLGKAHPNDGLASLQKELHGLTKLVHRLETAPKYARSIQHVEDIRQHHAKLADDIALLKVLMTDLTKQRDFGLLEFRK